MDNANRFDPDKIVAAILSTAYVSKNAGLSPADFVQAYEEIYREMKRREKEMDGGGAPAPAPTDPKGEKRPS